MDADDDKQRQKQQQPPQLLNQGNVAWVKERAVNNGSVGEGRPVVPLPRQEIGLEPLLNMQEPKQAKKSKGEMMIDVLVKRQSKLNQKQSQQPSSTSGQSKKEKTGMVRVSAKLPPTSNVTVKKKASVNSSANEDLASDLKAGENMVISCTSSQSEGILGEYNVQTAEPSPRTKTINLQVFKNQGDNVMADYRQNDNLQQSLLAIEQQQELVSGEQQLNQVPDVCRPNSQSEIQEENSLTPIYSSTIGPNLKKAFNSTHQDYASSPSRKVQKHLSNIHNEAAAYQTQSSKSSKKTFGQKQVLPRQTFVPSAKQIELAAEVQFKHSQTNSAFFSIKRKSSLGYKQTTPAKADSQQIVAASQERNELVVLGSATKIQDSHRTAYESKLDERADEQLEDVKQVTMTNNETVSAQNDCEMGQTKESLLKAKETFSFQEKGAEEDQQTSDWLRKTDEARAVETRELMAASLEHAPNQPQPLVNGRNPDEEIALPETGPKLTPLSTSQYFKVELHGGNFSGQATPQKGGDQIIVGLVQQTGSTFYQYVDKSDQVAKVRELDKLQQDLADDGRPAKTDVALAIIGKPPQLPEPRQPLSLLTSFIVPVDASLGGKKVKGKARYKSHHAIEKGEHVFKVNKASFIIREETASRADQTTMVDMNNPSVSEISDVDKFLPRDSRMLKQHMEELKNFGARRNSSGQHRSQKKQMQPKQAKETDKQRHQELIEIALQDPGSRNTLKMIKQLFGETHAESRDLIHQLQVQMTRSKISLSDEKAIEMSKRPKGAPVLDQTKFQVDKQIESESRINPLLVKQKPLELPRSILDELGKLKQYTQAKKAFDSLPVISRVRSQNEMLRPSQSALGLTSLARIASQEGDVKESTAEQKSDASLARSAAKNSHATVEKVQFRQHQSTSPSHPTPGLSNGKKNGGRSTSDMSCMATTPIYFGQHKLMSQSPSQISQKTPSKKLFKLSQITEIKRKLESSQRKTERKARAYMNLKRQDLIKKHIKQKVLKEMHETRLVQQILISSAQSKQEQIKRQSLERQRVIQARINERASIIKLERETCKELPRASISVFQNQDELNSIIERITDEQDAFRSTVRQTSENRRLVNLAKQQTWQSTTSIVEKRLSERENSKQDTYEQSKNDSTRSLERLVRGESSNRRRTLQALNQKIKLSNLEKIYKVSKQQSVIEQSSIRTGSQVFESSPLEPRFKFKDENQKMLTQQVHFLPLTAVSRREPVSAQVDSQECSSSRHQQNSQRIGLEGLGVPSNLAIVDASERSSTSEEETDSNKIQLPNIVLGCNQSQSISQGSQRDHDDYKADDGNLDYQNMIMSETLDGGVSRGPPETKSVKDDRSEGRLIQSVLSRHSNSEEPFRMPTVAVTAAGSFDEGVQTNLINQPSVNSDGTGHMLVPQGVSLAELVTMQTQQIANLHNLDSKGSSFIVHSKVAGEQDPNHVVNTSPLPGAEPVSTESNSMVGANLNRKISIDDARFVQMTRLQSDIRFDQAQHPREVIGAQLMSKDQGDAQRAQGRNFRHISISTPQLQIETGDQRSNQRNCGKTSSMPKMPRKPVRFSSVNQQSTASNAPHVPKLMHQHNASQGRLETQSQGQSVLLPSLFGAQTAENSAAGDDAMLERDENLASYKTLTFPMQEGSRVQQLLTIKKTHTIQTNSPSPHGILAMNPSQASAAKPQIAAISLHHQRSQSIPRHLHRSFTPLKAFKRSQLQSIAQMHLMAEGSSTENDGSLKTQEELVGRNLRQEVLNPTLTRTPQLPPVPLPVAYRGVLPPASRNPKIRKPNGSRFRPGQPQKWLQKEHTYQQQSLPQTQHVKQSKSPVKSQTRHKLQVNLSSARHPELSSFAKDLVVQTSQEQFNNEGMTIQFRDDVLQLPPTNFQTEVSVEENKKATGQNINRDIGKVSLMNHSPVNIQAMKIEQVPSLSPPKRAQRRGFKGNHNNSQLLGNLEQQKLYRYQMEQIAKQKAAELRKKLREARKNHKPFNPPDQSDMDERGVDRTQTFHNLIEHDDSIFSDFRHLPSRSQN